MTIAREVSTEIEQAVNVAHKRVTQNEVDNCHVMRINETGIMGMDDLLLLPSAVAAKAPLQ